MGIFRSKERWILSFFILFGIAGALFFASFYSRISPAASLQFQVSRPKAKEIAQTFLNKKGYDVKEYRYGILFQSDQDEAVFLEKTLGTLKANQFFEEEYAPWYWQIRWFRFLEEEEFSIAVSPKGEIVGFFHQMPETKGEGFLSEEEALQTCRDFFKQSLQINLDLWIPISHEQKDLEHRRDHEFQWAPIRSELNEGKLILYCRIEGKEINSFSKLVQVPDAFEAKQEQATANRGLLTRIFNVLYLILGIFVGTEFILSFKRSFFRWRLPLFLSAGVFFLTLVSELNSLSFSWISLSTKETLSHFVLTEFLSSLVTALWAWLFVLMVAVAAENTQTFVWRKKPLLRDLFSRNYFLSKDFIQSTVIGYCLGAMQLGYVAAYYLIANRYFDGWSPLDSPYFNVASSFLPWIFPLTVGLTAALNEELFFRMFSISFLKKWLSSRALAVVIPAVIWGFLHSDYVVEPIYSRGLELALVGIVLGAVYLRYGILPTMLCHYTYNSVLGFIPLLRSESFFFQFSGWLSLFWILLPGLLALVSFIWIRKKKLSGLFVKQVRIHRQLREKKIALFRWGSRLAQDFFLSAASHTSAPQKQMPFEKGLWTWPRFAILTLALAAACLFLWFERPMTFGPSPQIQLGKEAAFLAAENFLSENGIKPPFEQKEVTFTREIPSDFNTLLTREVGVEKANEILKREKLFFLRWGVLFYQLKEREKLSVSVDETGRVVGFYFLREDHSLPGQELSVEKAKELALELFKKQRSFDWERFHYVGEKSSQVRQRKDHIFLWEQPLPEAPQLRLRIKILIQGETLGGYEEGVFVPQGLLRQQQEKKFLETFSKGVFALVLFAGVVLLVWDVIRQFRTGQFQWRAAAWIGLLFLVCDLIAKANAFSDIKVSLIETSPLNPWVFLFEKGLNLLIAEVATFGFVVFLAAYGLALIEETFGRMRFPTKKMMFQGGALGILAFSLLWLTQQYLTAFQLRFLADSSSVSYPFFKESVLNTFFPLLQMGISTFKSALLLALSLGVMLAFLLRLFKKPIFVFLFLGLFSSIQFFASHSKGSDIAIQVGLQLLILFLLYLSVLKLFRWNLMFYFYFFWVRELFKSIPLLLSTDSTVQLQGFGALFWLFLPLLILLFFPKRRGKTG